MFFGTLVIHVFCVLYLQDYALWYACSRDAARTQELLSLGVNVNNQYGPVSYSAHIAYYIVGVLGINTLY